MRLPCRGLLAPVVAALLALGSGTPLLLADPPSITGLSPRGAQRGQTVVLVVEGANLAQNPELLLALPAPRALLDAEPNKPAPNRLSFKLKISETDAPGPYPLRIRTDEGLSNPVLFLVGTYPEVAEVEPNDVFEAAKPLQPPVTVNGSLGPADRDTFKVSAKAGQRLVFEVEARRIGSGVDPTLHLLAANGREIAMNEDGRGLDVDARIDHTFSADGDYLIQVHDAMYLPQNPSFYRLKIGPFVYADGVFPLGGRRGSEVVVAFEGGNLAQRILDRVRMEAGPSARLLRIGLPPAVDTAGALPFSLRIGDLPEVIEGPRAKPEEPEALEPPLTVNGRLERPGEIDGYALAVKPGQKWVFEVEAQSLGSLLDGVLELKNPQGARLAQADDNGPSADPRLEFTVPEGLTGLVVQVEDLHRRGGTGFAYRLTVKESAPDFLLRLATPAMNLPLKGTEIIAVDVVRRGYNGPVRLAVVDLPPGFALRGGLVPAGQAKGYLTVSAPPAGRLTDLEFLIRGYGEGDVPTALAQGSITLASDRGMPVSPFRLEGVAAALTRALPIVLKAEEGPVRVALGQSRAVKVQALRAEGGAGAIKLQGIFAPPGITVAEGAIAENAAEGTLAFNAAPNAPQAEGETAVRAVIKLGGKDVSIVAPIFTAVVVPPFASQVAKAAIEAPLGGMAVLEGQIQREAPFAGDVELKVEGMPAGMTAPPVVVPGAQASFKVLVAAADPAKPGKHELKLVASTKLGDPKTPTVYASPALPFTLTLAPPAAAASAGGAAEKKPEPPKAEEPKPKAVLPAAPAGASKAGT